MRSKAPQPLDLDQLNSTYDVLGERADRKDARQLLATRKSDGLPVTISVFQPPPGDQGNALSHLAADVNRLVGLRHAPLIPIIAGQWLGTDALAIVTPRVDAPTLEEVLSRRDEAFSYARIARVLREVNAVIEWARGQKFVHRVVNLDTVHLDPGSDEVRVAFSVRALPRTGMPTALDDARTIASLARAMLTRSPAAPEREDQPLAELRPGLPSSVLRETDELLQAARGRAGGDDPDVTGYISRLAMADDLKRGEVHLEKSRNAIKEAHRKAKEEIEAQRKQHEEQLATAKAEHERLVAEQARAFAKERSEFEAELEKQRQALAKERQALANERAAHSRAAEALGQEREAHKRDCEALSRERAEHKRQAAALTAQIAEHRHQMSAERKRLTAELEALQQRATHERQQLLERVTSEQREAAQERKRITAQLEALQRQTVEERKQAAALLAARLEEQKRVAASERQRIAEQLAKEKREAAEEKRRLAAQLASVATTAPRTAPVPAALKPQTPNSPKPPKPPKSPEPAGPVAWRIPRASQKAVAWASKARGRWNRSWNVPAAMAGALLLLAGVTFAASARRGDDADSHPAASAVAPAPTAPVVTSTAPNVVLDSVGGGVTPLVDSTRATVTTRPREAQSSDINESEPAAQTPAPILSPTPSRSAPVAPPPARSQVPSAFDLMGVSPIPLREGNVRLDSLGRPPRDSARRDTFPRYDTLPRRAPAPRQ